jgi:DNA end-binding protein Ku
MSQPLPQPAPCPGTFPHLAAPPLGRPSWSGLLQLSLVNIPLKAYPAVRTRDVPSAHLLHAECGQRVRYAKHCPDHGPVDAAAIVRGYEYGPGQHLVVEPEELEALRPAQDRALRLERFLEPAQLDPLLFSGRSLFLVPDGPAAEPAYRVLLAGMVERGRWAVGRMVLGGHRQVVLVRPAGDGLLLQVLHYPEQVRSCPSSTGTHFEAASAELHLAGLLIDAASGAVDWSSYRDQTAEELRGLLEAKLQGQTAVAEPAAVVLPLLEALQQSVAAAQGRTAPAAGKPARAARKRSKRPA